ncbi:hypothetical protein BHE74_00040559 [Ensete ventricosum]|nr:hypothetical protein BHE74_00040559 [Ensete ventricosum]
MRWLVLFLSVFSSISLRAPVAIAAASIARTIVVDLKGGGDFESIQQAIDSVGSPSPTLYLERVGRSCGGVSREKVNVKSTKSYIVLEGDGAQTTSIEWGDYSDSSGRTTDASATFTSYASNFVAKSITFKVSLICSSQDLVTFVESGCTGPGSNLSGRVKWEKQPSDDELKKFIDISYIDGEGWLDAQPPLD